MCKSKEGTKASHEARKETRGRGGEIGGQKQNNERKNNMKKIMSIIAAVVASAAVADGLASSTIVGYNSATVAQACCRRWGLDFSMRTARTFRVEA